MSSHGQQVRRSGPNGDETYCPGRDVVNIFPSLLRQLTARYNAQHWSKLLVSTSVNMRVTLDEANEAICQAHDVFFKFLGECCKDSNEKYGDVLRRLGWEQIPSEARNAYYTMLGTLTAGLMFASLRDVHQEGEVPPSLIKSVIEFHLDEARRLENEISSTEEGLAEFRNTVRQCRAAGLSYDDLQAAIQDLKLGRVS